MLLTAYRAVRPHSGDRIVASLNLVLCAMCTYDISCFHGTPPHHSVYGSESTAMGGGSTFWDDQRSVGSYIHTESHSAPLPGSGAPSHFDMSSQAGGGGLGHVNYQTRKHPTSELDSLPRILTLTQESPKELFGPNTSKADNSHSRSHEGTISPIVYHKHIIRELVNRKLSRLIPLHATLSIRPAIYFASKS